MRRLSCFAFGLWALLATACTARGEREPLIYSFFGLDTINQVQFYPTDNRDYRQMSDLAERQVFQTGQWFNAYDSGSSISQLNKNGTAVLPQEVIQVIQEALRVSQLSGGAFDATVRPLVTLWDIGGNFPRVPAPADVSASLALVDYRKVEIDAQQGRVSFSMSGMGLDLGGIAKGYAADRMADIFRQKGVEVALINLGGNILLLGKKPEGQPWRLGLRSGAKGETSMELALFLPLAVSTAGVFERFFEQDGKYYHHILDPSTGYPVDTDLASVTVLSQGSSMTADALSTALLILGVEKGMELVRQTRVEAIFVGKDKTVMTSGGVSLREEGSIRITQLSPGYRFISQNLKNEASPNGGNHEGE